MAIIESLKTLGIQTDDPDLVVIGLNRLVLSREQKIKLFREYAKEKQIIEVDRYLSKIEG